jgi:hypothetical protein
MTDKKFIQTGDAFPREIGAPAIRAFIAAGFTSIEQLSGVSERELLELHGVGAKAIRIVKATLTERALPPLAP